MSATSNKGVSSRREGPVLCLVLDNPPANVLSLAVMRQMQAALEEARKNDGIRVVVVSAEGRLFCSGHDLKEMTAHRNDPDRGRAFFEETFSTCARLMQAIASHPRPVIAQIDGVATAAGCQLVASCDLAFASDQSRFGVNGIDVGLFCSTPMVALTRNVKPKHAMEMLMTGEIIDAATAHRIGLVNRVVARQDLVEATRGCARAIAAKPPAVVSIGKKAFHAQSGMDLAQAYALTSQVMIDNMLAEEAKEGIGAFIEKRRPNWPGR